MPASWTEGEIDLVAELAYELHLQGKYADAATLFQGLLDIDPRNVYCLSALAALSLKLGSAEDALGYASRALALSPTKPEALACRCEANVLLNRFAAAQRDLELMEQLQANGYVARLAMRLASAEKFSSISPADTTSQEADR